MASEQGTGRMARILAQAYCEALAGLPKMLRKRAAVMQTGRLRARQLLEIFRRFGIGARDIALRD